MKMVIIIQVKIKMEKDMEKENYILKMVIYYMKVIILMINQKVMESVFMMNIFIIQDNLKKEKGMEKEKYIKIINQRMRGILSMAILKVMENRLMKMGIIISGNLKKT